MVGKIGVLALQGAFAKHAEMLACLGVQALEIRYPSQLSDCDGLIIPGGESTTMTRQILEMDFGRPLTNFAQCKPVFGTCAGMILMAKAGILGLLDITVERNAYGRQCDSFSHSLPVSFAPNPVHAIFIRAPRIISVDAPSVHILASYQDEPVCVQQGHHLATTFHPELTQDPSIHRYFIQICDSVKK